MKDTIIVLDDLEKIRQRPGMYIGDNDKTGLHTIIREIIDNAVDEYVNYPDKDKPIEVTVKKDNIVTVRDHGRGISPYQSKEVEGEIEERLAFTRIGAGGKFRENREDTGNMFSGGLNGTGAAGANAMSEYFHVTIYKDGYIFHDKFEDGIPVTKLIKGNLPKEKQKVKETGTEITFKPSDKYMQTTKINTKRLAYNLQQVSYLNPSLTIHFTNERDDEETVYYHSPGGLYDYMDSVAINEENEPVKMLVEPFLVSGETTADVMGQTNHMKMNVLTAFASGDAFGAEALTNGIENPSGGTHLRGFYIGMRNLLQHYYKEFLPDFSKKYRSQLRLIQKIYELPNIGEVFSLVQPRDISRHTFVILDFKHNDPILKPQTKDELVSPEARDAVAEMYYKNAMLYLDRNIPAIQEIIGKLIKHLHERAKRRDTRVNLDNSDIAQTVSTKLAAARRGGSRDKREIFIVEGDSAGGTLKENRDSNYQAVLPLRGKVPNAKRTLFNRLMDNEEIATLTATINTGIADDYDDNKRMYDKVIIATDQDVDGLHIRVLIITYLLEYMPELIENGHVYYLDTPLFVNIMKGKEDSIYCYTEKEQQDLLDTRIDDIAEIQRKKGLGELTKKQVIETILTPETRHLSRLVIGDADALVDQVEMLMGREVQGRRKLFTGNTSISNN